MDAINVPNKFGFTGDSKTLVKLASSLGNSMYIIFSTLGTICLTMGAAFVGSYTLTDKWGKTDSFSSVVYFFVSNPWLYILFGCILFIFGAIGVYKDQNGLAIENNTLKKNNARLSLEKSESDQRYSEQMANLNKSINRAQEDSQLYRSKISEIHSNLVSSWLKGVAKSINLDTHSRVSIYYQDNESFSILARYSQNPKLSKTHKQRFALNQGVISQSWQHGCFFECKAPSYSKNPTEYNSFMIEHYKYTESELDSINMKSCRYFGLAIKDVDDHIGVILFESTEENFCCEKMRESIRTYCEKYQSHLCSFVRDGLGYDKVSSRNHHQSTINGAGNDLLSLKELLK